MASMQWFLFIQVESLVRQSSRKYYILNQISYKESFQWVQSDWLIQAFPLGTNFIAKCL